MNQRLVVNSVCGYVGCVRIQAKPIGGKMNIDLTEIEIRDLIFACILVKKKMPADFKYFQEYKDLAFKLSNALQSVQSPAEAEPTAPNKAVSECEPRWCIVHRCPANKNEECQAGGFINKCESREYTEEVD
jgi:hypothetical protein